jgi:ABC-type nitrate/sulfonate/bicarbonate transport system permease component
MYPLMTAFNALPKAAFVPILVVWFGIGIGPAILTAFLIASSPIMVNIATGWPRSSRSSRTCCACWARSRMRRAAQGGAAARDARTSSRR